MTESKHTPGPWTAVRGKHGWNVDLHQHYGICSIRDNTDGSGQQEHEANAKLIAAAPELLLALEQLHYVLWSGEPNYQFAWDQVWADTQDAINKAKATK